MIDLKIALRALRVGIITVDEYRQLRQLDAPPPTVEEQPEPGAPPAIEIDGRLISVPPGYRPRRSRGRCTDGRRLTIEQTRLLIKEGTTS